MNTRTIPLTLCWYLLLWRGGSRFAAGPVRTYDPEKGRTRTIGATLSVCRFTIGLAQLGRGESVTTRGHWYRDRGRFSIGGWRTDRCVPLSTGWITGGADRCGFLITVASRTLYAMRWYSRADYKTYRRNRALYGSAVYPYSGRGRQKKS